MFACCCVHIYIYIIGGTPLPRLLPPLSMLAGTPCEGAKGHYNGLTARSDQRVLCFLQLDVPQRGYFSRCAAGCLIKVLMHQLVHNLVGPCCLHRLRLLQDLLHYTGFFYGSLESQSALRCSARAARVSSSRGDTHCLSWIDPSHSQARLWCSPLKPSRTLF